MSRGSRLIGVVGIVVLAGLAAAVVLCEAQPAAAKFGGARAGRFEVVAGENSYVMYDPAGGTSWVLLVDPKHVRHAWFPLKRLRTEADIHSWRIRRKATSDLLK